jgi:hypothetical protein
VGISEQNPRCGNAHCPEQDRHCDTCHVLEVIATGRKVIAEKKRYQDWRSGSACLPFV